MRLALAHDARRKLQREGVVATAKAATTELRRYAAGTTGYQADRRVDLDERWSMIQPHVRAGDSVLDIGCAEGELTKRCGDVGAFALGLDFKTAAIQRARSGVGLRDGARFVRHEFTPENIDRLPSFDVTLLLTVYHHWIRQYGQADAEAMLASVCERTNRQLVFEAPGNRPDGLAHSHSGDIVAYWRSYLDAVLDDSATVEVIGTADYKGGARDDPVFLVGY